MPAVYVAAGSNVEPERRLRQAIAALEKCYAPLRVSPAYRNPAVGFEGDDFVNLVVGFKTNHTMEHVRDTLQRIENECGRPSGAPKWAPRTMDLDILLYGDAINDTPGLLLPRPDLLLRPFMLGPLADIAPDVVHPTERKSIAQLWREFDRGAHPMTPVSL